MADLLSKIAGKTINYTSPTTELYTETLSKAGVPVEYVAMFSVFAEAIKQGEFTAEHNDLEDLLGRKPTFLTDFLIQTYPVKKNKIQSNWFKEQTIKCWSLLIQPNYPKFA